MPEAVQALCFLAGANSIFYGDKLLTTGNPEAARDRACWKSSAFAPSEHSDPAPKETFGVVRCLPFLRPCHDVAGSSGLEISSSSNGEKKYPQI